MERDRGRGTEGQKGEAQREREASKGQVCTRRAQNKWIARPQGPVSQGLQALLPLHHQTCLAPKTCSLLVELGVEDAFTAHAKISANVCSKKPSRDNSYRAGVP